MPATSRDILVAARRGAWWRVLDERHPRGGRAKAWLFVTHPGPSLLVTAVTVAAAGVLARRPPGERTVAGIVLVMLPAQLAIGALNDWADAAADRAGKPFKPIARGLVGRAHAGVLALGCAVVSLGAAAYLGGGVLLVDLLGLGAGVAYDLGLERTPAAVVAWAAGFVAVPLLAMVVSGRLRGGVATLPLAGLLAVGLLIANGLPDREADMRGGGSTLPAVLGERASLAVMAAALVASGAAAAGLGAALGLGPLAGVAALILVAAGALAALPPRARPLLFPAAALAVAAAAISWLAALGAAG